MTMPNQMHDNDGRQIWQNWANLALAVWLFISPWILQFAPQASTSPPAQGAQAAQAVMAVSDAAWNAWVLGAVVFVIGVSAIGRLVLWQEWANLVLGAWIFVAPWALGFAMGAQHHVAAWDHWIVGGLIFLISAWSISSVQAALHSHHEDVTHQH